MRRDGHAWRVRRRPRIEPLTTEDSCSGSFSRSGWRSVPALALAAININTATKDELVALPGIGPAKAQAILDYRKAHGPFKTVEDLKDVKGIGAKRFEQLKPDLAVSGPSTAQARGEGRRPRVRRDSAQGEVALGQARSHRGGTAKRERRRVPRSRRARS